MIKVICKDYFFKINVIYMPSFIRWIEVSVVVLICKKAIELNYDFWAITTFWVFERIQQIRYRWKATVKWNIITMETILEKGRVQKVQKIEDENFHRFMWNSCRLQILVKIFNPFWSWKCNFSFDYVICTFNLLKIEFFRRKQAFVSEHVNIVVIWSLSLES